MKIISYLYIVWALFIFSFFMILFLPFFLIPPVLGKSGLKVTYYFLRLWSWLFSKLNHIPYEISGRENIVKNQSYVVVSNHTSFLDLPGICLALPGQFRPLAKAELGRLPIFGWIARTATVMVDRASHESRKKSMEILNRTLQDGVSILIFAEGTQNRTSQPLQPFKDGAFKLALETGADILPVVISGAGRLMPPGKFFIRPGKIQIKIGSPILLAESPQKLQQLKERTFEVMNNMLLDPIKSYPVLQS